MQMSLSSNSRLALLIHHIEVGDLIPIGEGEYARKGIGNGQVEDVGVGGDEECADEREVVAEKASQKHVKQKQRDGPADRRQDCPCPEQVRGEEGCRREEQRVKRSLKILNFKSPLEEPLSLGHVAPVEIGLHTVVPDDVVPQVQDRQDDAVGEGKSKARKAVLEERGEKRKQRRPLGSNVVR